MQRAAIKRWLPEAAILFAIVVLIAPLLPSVMRENDQASLVRGAYEIAFQNRSPFGADLYRYDKLFGSYLILAVVDKALPDTDPVTSANLFQLVLWMAATTALLFRGASLPHMARALLLTTMVSPVWILSIPFFSPAAISAYTLMLAFLIPIRGWPGMLVEALLVFVAISFRADAILAVPFLVWSKSARSGFRGLIAHPRTVLVVIGGISALALGPFIAGAWTVFATPPRIIPKVLLAFAVFGLGPAALAFGYVVIALARAARMPRARVWYSLGLASFALPLVYYAPQLLSPRYLLLTVAVTLSALTTRPISALLSLTPPNLSRVAVATAGIVALVPLVIGVQLPRITSPRLTVTRATTFPSADGHWPMGAVAGFAYGARRHSHVSIDHNQAIYEAARNTEYQGLCTAGVPVLRTPMVSYLELALTIKGLRAEVIDHAGQQGCETAYADLRSLTHEWLHPFEPDASPKELPRLRVVSPPITNQPIVLVGQEDDPILRRGLTALRDQFQGREFEVLFRRKEVVSLQPGSVYRLVAPAGFVAETICGDLRRRLSARHEGGLYHAAFTTDREGCTITLPSRRDIMIAHTVLASYMSLQ